MTKDMIVKAAQAAAARRNEVFALNDVQVDLLTTAWGYEYVGASRTVDVHINRLRTKLGLDKEIQTVFKVGYRLNTQ